MNPIPTEEAVNPRMNDNTTARYSVNRSSHLGGTYVTQINNEQLNIWSHTTKTKQDAICSNIHSLPPVTMVPHMTYDASRARQRNINSHNNIDIASAPDDADVAAGNAVVDGGNMYIPSGILKRNGGTVADFDCKTANGPSGADSRMMVLGINISHLNDNSRFLVCAGGVFGFSLVYGFLQELISVTIYGRQLGLFLAVVQFCGYTSWSYLFRNVERKNRQDSGFYNRKGVVTSCMTPSSSSLSLPGMDNDSVPNLANTAMLKSGIPTQMYIGLSVVRAVDLGMTNLAMQYLNYPAKTLMKSSRVVFTMLFGVIIARKKYSRFNYFVVALMVTGLALFLHADSHSSAVFQPIGIVMLSISLMCDGAISNISESLMRQYNVGQDEYIFRLYSLALGAITVAAAYKGDLWDGIQFMMVPGTLEEIESGSTPTWDVLSKIIVVFLFSSTGFFGSSCSAAITKEYGALTMSITSTARKATTLFLSFAMFKNACSFEHIVGIVLFIAALVVKSLGSGGEKKKSPKSHIFGERNGNIELGTSHLARVV
mmetsp:Transcript_48535/g.71983  ORF Transcript_48535/g.71983 Transcript_48535/m.71983 type:complete len:542 (-) Transcript_48535:218-1843(-)|eukprot:CAMPEP_0195536314 /NCGR_PEP_ID=MMETSP0794_2-20130614/45851_1 /TAXON_ID=515487 /ORGANISM="Stephanopyxis turris, Strain CCMP 815" /LENGTH=541 /DNA_ID=CAMNT_0040669691 /DNA_START=24 /DNA_END=1649 /DNA_ORIENTATION=-